MVTPKLLVLKDRAGIIRRQRIVDFNVFKIEYWVCLSNMVPPSCSPELLFSEIMGIIKGSSPPAWSLESLTREKYLSRSSKRSQSFSSEADREKVYSAFERYEKLKRQQNEIDELDRVLGLLRSLKNEPSLAQLARQCFEEIYVDGNILLGCFHFTRLTVTRGSRFTVS